MVWLRAKERNAMSDSRSKLRRILDTVRKLDETRKRRVAAPTAESLEARRLLSVTVGDASGYENTTISISASASEPGPVRGWHVHWPDGTTFDTFDNTADMTSISIGHSFGEEGSGGTVTATALWESVDSANN